jgi:phosphodiesterase/alkaline phosphatase D-like protein
MRALWTLATAACLTAGIVGAAAQTQPQQNPNPQQQKENAQEKASGINDAVDIVSGPTVEGLRPDSANLTWTTNKAAATRVMYGTDAKNPSQHAYEPGGATQHRVQLKNLTPGTTYHYEIETGAGKDRFKGSFQTPK